MDRHKRFDPLDETRTQPKTNLRPEKDLLTLVVDVVVVVMVVVVVAATPVDRMDRWMIVVKGNVSRSFSV